MPATTRFEAFGLSEPAADRNTAVMQLADILLARHVRVSVPHRSMRESLFQSDFAMLANVAPRVFAVVGAGASAPHFARASELADGLVKRHVATGTSTHYEEEVRRLQKAYGLDPDEFETKVAAIASSGGGSERDVRRAICEIYDRRHPTVVGYELLAHFLRHRFIDGIISFNFDELLDQSLEDELGLAEYRTIVSPRDCRGIIFDVADPQYVPVYVKLHGTASDPESLRFTRDAYYSLPDALNESVAQLLGADGCVLMGVGFGFRSFDFTQLLGRPMELKVYSIGHAALTEGAVAEITSARTLRTKSTLAVTSMEFGSVVNASDPATGAESYNRDPSLSATDIGLAELRAAMRSRAEEVDGRGLVPFRKTSPHEVMPALLGTVDPTDREQYMHYLRDRCYLELACAMVKSRGLISILTLANSTASTYFGLAQDCGSHLSWKSACAIAGLVEARESSETYVPHQALVPNDAGDGFRGPGERLSRVDHETLIDNLARNLATPLTALDLADLSRLLSDLVNGSEIEIATQADTVCRRLFLRPKVLPTITALKARTHHMFSQSRYNQVAIGAETGEWLLNKDIVRLLLAESRQIVLVVAFDWLAEDLQELYGDHLRMIKTDWWRLNRRTTLVLNDGVPQAAIYFARRLRAVEVTPVYISDPADTERVWANLRLTFSAAVGMDGLDLPFATDPVAYERLWGLLPSPAA